MSTAGSLESEVGRGKSGSVRRAGVILGLGLGGLIDGIVFHQVLQWHHMICFSCHPGATI
jgi:uncharacterized membrane protein